MSTEQKPSAHPSVVRADPRQQRATGPKRNARLLRAAAAVVLLGIAVSVGYALVARAGGTKGQDQIPVGTVMRGDLPIYVTEGGALVAIKSLELKSEVEGQRSIVEIADEGTVITQEDVDKGKVLVRLDSSELEERGSSREISFYNAESSYTQARENYAIQQKQNESNVAIAELKAKFALMELERYLGAELAQQVVQEKADFRGLGDYAGLGGMAQQALRNYGARVQLANEELSRASDTLDWTKKLFEKGYVTREQLAADELLVTRRRIELTAADEELRLFKRYTLPKEAEQRYSDHVEAVRDLDRVKARARSELAQREADLKSREASYELEKDRLAEAKQMVEHCIIKAPKPGRVVYASTSDSWHRMNNPIRAGSNVRQNQVIISIPDLSTLAARVNIHETDIEKVKLGQRAAVTVEAMPGRSFPGKVTRISPVASAAQAWLNPEIKVYETDIALDQGDEGLTPGMTASAQLAVAQLKDVLYVPIEAVTTYRGQRTCVVKSARGPEVRPVETGFFTEKAVEIRSGLQAGEPVYLAPADVLGEQSWQLTPQPTPEELRLIEERTQPSAAAPAPAASPEQAAPAASPEQAAPAAAPEAGAPKAAAPQAAAPQAAAPQAAAPEQPEAAGAAAAGAAASIDWRKIGQEMMSAKPEERAAKWQEILDKATPEQRKVLEEAGRRWQSASPEDRAGFQQRGGGEGGQGGGGQ